MFFTRKEKRNTKSPEGNDPTRLEDESAELKFQRKFLRCLFFKKCLKLQNFRFGENFNQFR